MKFKIGDKVKRITNLSNYSKSITVGSVGIVKGQYVSYNENNGDDYIAVEWAIEPSSGDRCNCSEMCSSNHGSWMHEKELALTDKSTQKQPTHVVIWDEQSRDPHQFFTDEKLAKNFVKELSERTTVIKGSILLAEIKTCKKVNIKKNLEYSAYKI